MTLAIFDSNRKHTKQFTQEFTLYRIVNQDSPSICNTYTQTVLALFFIQGVMLLIFDPYFPQFRLLCFDPKKLIF